MQSFDLVTGEAVALDLRPAALPSRMVAGALDTLLQFALLAVLALLAAATGTGTSSAGQAAITVVVLLAVTAGYPVAFESLLRGRTPGKAVMGLRVVRDDGGPIGFRQALVRGLTATFVERPGITLFTGAVVCMLVNSRSKRLGDLLAGTLVLQERIPGGDPALRSPGVPHPQLGAWSAELDLTGLPDELALSARAYLGRARELTDAARAQLGARLAGAVAAVVTPPPPQGTPAGAYLAAVLAERSRRAQLTLQRPEAPNWWSPAPAPVSWAPVASAPALTAPGLAAPGLAARTASTPEPAALQPPDTPGLLSPIPAPPPRPSPSTSPASDGFAPPA